jgi:hypothetical protein
MYTNASNNTPAFMFVCMWYEDSPHRAHAFLILVLGATSNTTQVHYTLIRKIID